MIALILQNGYMKKGYGFTKITKSNDCKTVHWVTVYDGGKVQLYSYYEGDEDSDNYVYNTNIVKMNVEQLGTFITVLCA